MSLHDEKAMTRSESRKSKLSLWVDAAVGPTFNPLDEEAKEMLTPDSSLPGLDIQVITTFFPASFCCFRAMHKYFFPLSNSFSISGQEATRVEGPQMRLSGYVYIYFYILCFSSMYLGFCWLEL